MALKTAEDVIYQLFDDMDFDVVVNWAGILDVEVNPPPLDDMWPDWEGELRQEVSEALLKAISPKMEKFYFTFGCGQTHANCYHVIEAKNSEVARKKMFERFGDKWSMQYNSAEEAGVERWNLTEIK